MRARTRPRIRCERIAACRITAALIAIPRCFQMRACKGLSFAARLHSGYERDTLLYVRPMRSSTRLVARVARDGEARESQAAFDAVCALFNDDFTVTSRTSSLSNLAKGIRSSPPPPPLSSSLIPKKRPQVVGRVVEIRSSAAEMEMRAAMRSARSLLSRCVHSVAAAACCRCSKVNHCKPQACLHRHQPSSHQQPRCRHCRHHVQHVAMHALVTTG